MGLLSEFKAFAMRGNVVDMAIGIIIGASFGKITSTLVNNVLMPVIGMVTGGVDFAQHRIVLKAAALDAAGKIVTPEVAVSYGLLINTVIDFTIVAFAMFLVVKLMNAASRKQQAAPTAPAAPSVDQQLLAEIRDLLKAKA
jgi:large conductance mechanosensitive channel